MTTTPTPPVEPGQVWADNDPRSDGRHCGGAAWDEPTTPEAAMQNPAAEHGQRTGCGCEEAPAADAELDRRLAAALATEPGTGDIHDVPTAPLDPLTVITRTLEDCRTLVPAVQAERVLAALQGLYVPPPPGSDRDALPEHLRPLITLNMAPYLSTGCQAGNACLLTAREHPEHAGELLAWADREHASCRSTRKQDMAQCRCACHGTGRPIAPAVGDASNGPVAGEGEGL